MTKEPNRFYVYAFLRERDSVRGKRMSPYYIGKGCGNRAWSNSGRKAKKPTDPSYIVLLRQSLDEDTAYEWEMFYISHYGRVDAGTGILWNMTDGGDGVKGSTAPSKGFSGGRHSEKTRRMYSETRRGSNNSHYGRKHSIKARGIMRVRHAKYLYQLIDENGNVYMTESLRDFCGQHNLCRRSLSRLLKGERDNYQDWKISIAEHLR
jgi:hypothetical protein